jgi:hypothetical protein
LNARTFIFPNVYTWNSKNFPSIIGSEISVDAGEPHYFIFLQKKRVVLISGKRSDFVFLGLLKRLTILLSCRSGINYLVRKTVLIQKTSSEKADLFSFYLD